MRDAPKTLEEEAGIMKRIDEELKGLSPDIREAAFQILVQRHLKGGRFSSETSNVAPKVTGGKHRGTKSSANLKVIQNLNLKKEGQTPSLRDLYAQKAPQSFSECNVLFVYYLNRLKETEDITPSHIFTCYKEVGARAPGAFYQSLLDTARIKGWVDTQDTNDIRITTVGENFVEHDMPKTKE